MSYSLLTLSNISDEKDFTPVFIHSSSTLKFGAWFIAIIPFSGFEPPSHQVFFVENK